MTARPKDHEVQVLRRIVKALKDLDDAAQRRIAVYLMRRFGTEKMP